MPGESRLSTEPCVVSKDEGFKKRKAGASSRGSNVVSYRTRYTRERRKVKKKPCIVAKDCGGLAVEEFFEEEAGEAAGVMADDRVFFEEIVEDDAEAELLEGRNVGGDRFGALRAIAPRDFGRNGLAIGDDPIDDAAGNVFLDGAEMIGKGVAGSFAGLRHQVGDVHARGFGLRDGAGNFRDQQIREDAGVKRARAEKNQVGLLDGFYGQ